MGATAPQAIGVDAQSDTYRVLSSCPRTCLPLAHTFVRAANREQAIIIGRRVLAMRGHKKLNCVSAHDWSPETDRELLRTGFVQQISEALK